MKFGWRYLKSFLVEEVLERSSSPFNEVLEVWYVGGKKVLHSKSVNYSFGELHKVFQSAFSQLNITKRPIKKCLILGLGVGSVPSLLTAINPAMEMVGVEIDEEVIRLGRNHFQLDRYKHMEVIVGDAVQYAGKCRLSFDLVIVDLFQDALIPASAETKTFLTHLDALLAPKGLLLYNRLVHSPVLRQQSEVFTRTMRDVLPGTKICRAHKNRILYYEKD